MKIEALRIAAFRRFSEPAAIEDFAAGVNVLAGPNEMGKSTFFHALEAAFTARHKVGGSYLEAMRPFGGGEPLVEADFTISGTRWRIRKQFGRGSVAALTDMTAGRVVARNAEAEEQLNNLIGRQGETLGPIGLVWVSQQKTLYAPDPDIDPLSGKEKPRGERSALQEAIGREVEAAAGGERTERVQMLVAAALDELLTKTRNAPKKNGPLDIARNERAATHAALELAERAALAAEQRLQAIATATAEIAALCTPEKAAERYSLLSKLEAAVAEQALRRGDFALAREAMQARASEAESARQTLDGVRSRLSQLAGLEAKRTEAEALEAAIALLSRDINGNAATPARIERLAALSHSRDLANAELRAEAARVDIALEPGGAGRVRVDGAAIASGMARDVPEYLEIDIDGIAKIRVTSAGAERAAAARTVRDAAEREMAELFSVIGCGTIEDARQRAEARARQVEELDRARGKLSGVAPQGAAIIAAEISRLTSVQHAAAADVSRLTAEVESRQAAAHVARESFDKLKSAVLSDDAFRKLSSDLQAARAGEDTAKKALDALTLRVEKLKSEQAGADEDGRAGQVDALKGTFERQDAEVKRLEAEGKALLLLAKTLSNIEAKSRDTFFEPVLRRVQPYLNVVLGAADLGFKDAFAIDALTRAGQREEFALLSDGTREQLSVLVRLGFAEVLAGRGVSVPLVLDDPLVYSDDERLAKVCRVLESASRAVQIIVLTCRATAFQTLSGHRVSVTRWQPDR